jgi:hypothetical protein
VLDLPGLIQEFAMLSSLLLPLSRWVPTATQPASTLSSSDAEHGALRLSLAHREVFALPVRHRRQDAQHIVCDRGSVWVTVDGRLEDVVLEAGQCFLAPAGSRTVVYALSPAQVRVRSGAAVSSPSPCAQTAQPAPWPGLLHPAIRLWSALRAHGI